MALRGLTLSSTFKYESDADPGKGTPEATVFTLGPVDVFVNTHLFDNSLDISDGDRVQFRNNEANLNVVRFGLHGWTNFKDEAGNDIPFETQERVLMGRKYTAISDDCLARVSFDEVRVMAGHIRDASTVKEHEAKNSEGA